MFKGSPEFRGSIVALITPFQDGKLDEQALRKLVDWHVKQGTHGIVAVGTTGESPTLSHDEHCKVIDICVDQAAGRIPVIAGAGSNNPIEAIEFSQHAEKAGADATLHVAGYYNKPNQRGLYEHFKAVHDNSGLPIIVYNIPGRAIVNITPENLAEMAKLPRIIGVKDATGDLSRPWLERELIGDDFIYLSGEDATASSYNASGGTGCISVTANVAPALCAEMQLACLDGDFAKARELQDKLMPLHRLMFAEPSPAGAKYACSLLGLCSAEARAPITELSDETKSAIRSAMEKLELI